MESTHKSLSSQVADLALSKEAALNLAAKILGTIRENEKRGNIKTATPKGDALLKEWIAEWYKELDALRFTEPEN